MKTLANMVSLKREKRAVTIAAGFFDGVHRGHVKVLAGTIARARASGGTAWMLTFDTHPAKVLRPAEAPMLLTSTRHKLSLVSALGIDGCLLLKFTRRLAAMEPRDFAERLCESVPTLREIIVGSDWRFGKDGRGNPAMLASLAARRNIVVTVVKPVCWKGSAISSTRIRKSVVAGRLAAAAAMLGRPFSILGTVRRGRAIGRKIGFPTANLDPHNEVRPPCGVYAVRAAVGRKWLDGVLNIGTRPTFGGPTCAPPSIELHLPGFRGQLYGRDIEVFFAQKIRNERRFVSAAELARQIARDVVSARLILRQKNHKII